jgi:hypothetical protein
MVMFGNWSKRRAAVKDAENYLKATDVVSRPMAILMSLAVFIILGSLLYSVFLGGRWVYDKLKVNDSPVATITTQQAGPGDSANTENVQQEFPAITDNQTPANTTPFTTTAPAASTSTPNTTSSAIPNTGPAVIPNTGPDESQP